jgi:RimJ/RimL family protein N-acetyltransferase
VVRRIPDEKEQQEVLQRPPGPYPAGEEASVVLSDGTPLFIRPIKPDDGKNLLGLYDRLSEQSLYFRFFAVPQPDPVKAEYLAHVDYVNQLALVAEADGAIVAVARYHRIADRAGHAEVAFTVADAWQGKGIGTLLLKRLARFARLHGIAVFDAEVLPENERMLRVFRRGGLPVTEERGGHVVQVAIRLDGPEPGA